MKATLGIHWPQSGSVQVQPQNLNPNIMFRFGLGLNPNLKTPNPMFGFGSGSNQNIIHTRPIILHTNY